MWENRSLIRASTFRDELAATKTELTGPQLSLSHNNTEGLIASLFSTLWSARCRAWGVSHFFFFSFLVFYQTRCDKKKKVHGSFKDKNVRHDSTFNNQEVALGRWPWGGGVGGETTMLGSTAGGRRSIIPFKAMSPGGVDTDLDSSLHEPLQ